MFTKIPSPYVHAVHTHTLLDRLLPPGGEEWGSSKVLVAFGRLCYHCPLRETRTPLPSLLEAEQ